jgi:phosphoribosylformylglycinamidine (FGAM) synthase-like enzyme
VSLYNEGATGPIYPTPVIGMVGRLPDAAAAGLLGFQRAGDQIALVGPFAPSLRASELAKLRGEALPDGLPPVDVDAVQGALVAVRGAVRARELSSAHDIAEGGLAIALAECCLAGVVGAQLQLGDLSTRATEALFGEGPGGFVVSAPGEALDRLAERVPLLRLGTVGGDSLSLSFELGASGAAADGADRAGGVAADGADRREATVAISLDELTQAHASLAELFS